MSKKGESRRAKARREDVIRTVRLVPRGAAGAEVRRKIGARSGTSLPIGLAKYALALFPFGPQIQQTRARSGLTLGSEDFHARKAVFAKTLNPLGYDRNHR